MRRNGVALLVISAILLLDAAITAGVAMDAGEDSRITKLVEDWARYRLGSDEDKYRSLFLPGKYSKAIAADYRWASSALAFKKAKFDMVVDGWSRNGDTFHIYFRQVLKKVCLAISIL